MFTEMDPFILNILTFCVVATTILLIVRIIFVINSTNKMTIQSVFRSFVALVGVVSNEIKINYSINPILSDFVGVSLNDDYKIKFVSGNLSCDFVS
jgi:hypothetical protein